MILKSIFKCGTILIDVLEVHLRKPVYVMSYLKIRYCLECSKLLTGLKLATYITKDNKLLTHSNEIARKHPVTVILSNLGFYRAETRIVWYLLEEKT